MKEPRFKKGTRVLVQPSPLSLLSSGVYHVRIVGDAKKGLFGWKYLCRWGVSTDLGGDYEKIGYVSEKRMLWAE